MKRNHSYPDRNHRIRFRLGLTTYLMIPIQMTPRYPSDSDSAYGGFRPTQNESGPRTYLMILIQINLRDGSDSDSVSDHFTITFSFRFRFITFRFRFRFYPDPFTTGFRFRNSDSSCYLFDGCDPDHFTTRLPVPVLVGVPSPIPRVSVSEAEPSHPAKQTKCNTIRNFDTYHHPFLLLRDHCGHGDGVVLFLR